MRSQRWRVWWWGGVSGVLLVVSALLWAMVAATFWGFEGRRVEQFNQLDTIDVQVMDIRGSRGRVVCYLIALKISVPGNRPGQSTVQRSWTWKDSTAGALGRFVWFEQRIDPKVPGGLHQMQSWTVAGWSIAMPTPLSGSPLAPGEQVIFGVGIPVWMVALFTTVISFWPLLRLRRARRRFALDHHICPSCGYDLRATPDRCPECGTVVAADPMKSAPG